MVSNWSSMFSRILFVVCVVIAALAVWERVLNAFGFTFVGGQLSPSRMLEFSAVGVLFVIALQLRELKEIERAGRSRGSI